MYKELTKLSLVSNFGKNASKPLRKAIYSIAGGSVAALVGGCLIARSTKGLILARGMPTVILVALLITIVFALTGFILMPIIHIFGNQQNALRNKLFVLPLDRKERWYVVVLPMLIIAGIITLFVAPLLPVLANATAANIFFVAFAYIAGIAASICYVMTVLPHRVLAKDLVFVTICASLLYLVEAALKNWGSLTAVLTTATVFAVFIGCYAIATYSYFSGIEALERVAKPVARLVLPSKVLSHTWFNLKLLRNHKGLASLSFCVVVSVSITIFNFVKNGTMLDPGLVIIVGAILVCSFATDLRAMVKRYKAPEIFDLLGVNFFINSEAKTMFFAGTFIIAPLFPVVLIRGSQDVVSMLIYAICLMIAAGFIGLMFGTIFIPENGEVGMQFFSGMAAIISLFGLPKVLKFSNLNLMSKSLCWLCIAGVCFLIIMLIEQLRKKGYGHVR